jgi:diguanylate cyclase (GGDEF)-like protein/PAS domain S-box-containing protein
MLVLTILWTLWLSLGPGSVGSKVVLFWLPQPALDLAFVLFSWRISREQTLAPASRRFWRATVWVAALFTSGDIVQTVITIHTPGIAAANAGIVQGSCLGIGVLIWVWVMLTYPTGFTGRQRVRLWLDAATVMTGAAVFAWYLTADSNAGVINGIVGPVLMLPAMFGVLKLFLGSDPPLTFLAGLTACLSACALIAGTLLGSDLSNTNHLGAILSVRLLSSVFITAATRIQGLQMYADPGALKKQLRPYSLLPYVAIVATHGLLATILINGQMAMRLWGVLIGVIAITICVVIRQLLAFSENAMLLGRLDASMLEVRRQEQRFRSLVQRASDITIISSADGTITYISPAVEQILGIAPGHSLGRPVLELTHPDEQPRIQALLSQLADDPEISLNYQTRAPHTDGSWRWLEVTSTNLLADPSVRGIVYNARDITEAKELHERLSHQASHDSLTQLANRAVFDENIEAAANSEDPTRQTAVLMIDLDEFKAVNDNFGHHVGDALLIEAGERLRHCVRPGDTLARLGGDEFAILLLDATPDHATDVANRIATTMTETIVAYGHELHVRASVGVATGRSEQAGALLRTADSAMYEAKQETKRWPPLRTSGSGDHLRPVLPSLRQEPSCHVLLPARSMVGRSDPGAIVPQLEDALFEPVVPILHNVSRQRNILGIGVLPESVEQHLDAAT